MVMEDDAFNLANDGDDGPKVVDPHFFLLKNSLQEEFLEEVIHSLSLQPTASSSRVKLWLMKPFPLSYSRKKEVPSGFDCEERNSDALVVFYSSFDFSISHF